MTYLHFIYFNVVQLAIWRFNTNNIFIEFLFRIIFRICYKKYYSAYNSCRISYVCMLSFYLNHNIISELFTITISVWGGGESFFVSLFENFSYLVYDCVFGDRRSIWNKEQVFVRKVASCTGKLICDICATWLNCGYRYLRSSYAPWAKSEIFLGWKTCSAKKNM